ncbi:MAG: diguanylate cyclase [Clostridia bacterium]|nr:diguanylate cyclase [Clostridia bacterium]
MREHSLQLRFLITVLSAILTVSVFVGGLSIYEVDNYVQRETENLVGVTCENEATKVNAIFDGMEKSVRIMENYVLSFFENAEDTIDPNKQNEVLKFADEMFVNVAKDTDGAIAYYLRLNPEISNSTAGIFFSKMNGGDDYVRFPPTDISLYDKDDVEHVGWYWQPYEAGKPIWMSPYHNRNNNVLMISFVVPLYVEGAFIGVVGMDFDYTVLTEIIRGIKIYENGFAHLERNGVVIQDGGEGVESVGNADKYLAVSEELANGMTLVLSADYDDIRRIRYDIGFKIMFIVFSFAFAFALLVAFLVKRITKPLKELTDASLKLSRGDYDVEIAHSNIREINLLSTAFGNMAVNLREHKNLQHRLAHRDSLTGLRNTTSYNEWTSEFDRRIKDGVVSFGIAVLDINGLKEINDTYGHMLGNELITTASGIICDTFKKSPVFRIGGDEFCVILQNRDLADIKRLFEVFDSKCESACVDKDGVKLRVSVAKGFAKFDPDRDSHFSDVFERADSEMYRNKKIMKASKS